jgi:hypothetical protein
MGHFSEEDWSDFAREQAAPEPRARMQRHVDEACLDCSRSRGFWNAVGRLAGQEASYEPPEAAVRRAKALYAVQKPEGLLVRAARAAALLFDSSRAPQPVGVRSGGPSPARQLLYRVGNRLVKLRLETLPETGRLSLIGQVVDEADPTRTFAELPVRVAGGGRSLAGTVTNQLGEFELEFEPAKNLSVVLSIPGARPFPARLPLRGDGESRGSSRGASSGGRPRRRSRSIAHP